MECYNVVMKGEKTKVTDLLNSASSSNHINAQETGQKWIQVYVYGLSRSQDDGWLVGW